MTRKSIPKAVSSYLAEIGAKGGKNGKGAKKTRDASHYRRMVETRRKNKRARS
jgi:hypothetical protein